MKFSSIIQAPLIVTLLIFTFTIFTLSITSHAEGQQSPSNFTDIPNNFWAKDEIFQLAQLGKMNGYPDGQYRPAALVTRGEAAKIISDTLKIPNTDIIIPFSDVKENDMYFKEIMSTSNLGIFEPRKDGTFGINEYISREEFATIIVRAFKLKDIGTSINFRDFDKINKSHINDVQIVSKLNIMTGKANGDFEPKTYVNRSHFAVILHRTLKFTKLIEKIPSVKIPEPKFSPNFIAVPEKRHFTELPIDNDVQTFIRSNDPLTFIGESSIKYAFAKDTIYLFAIKGKSAYLKVTKRLINNGDYFIFTELKNFSNELIKIDIIRKQVDIENSELHRYDRYPIEEKYDDTFGYDPTSYPTGIIEKAFTDGSISQEMIGQAYRSKELKLTYSKEAFSHTRDLVDETEAYSSVSFKDIHISINTLISHGYDFVDHWSMISKNHLFHDRKNMDNWMSESAINFRKRNSWYTAEGPYNKMATSVEPLPLSFQVYGRNLLLVKEDRALYLYLQNKEPYFFNLIVNSFVNLQNFKGEKKYWETEVTSTYLKNLYNITAPFIDTRFNEQIALFLYESGKDFKDPNYQTPLKNYADLLVSQESKGNVIHVDPDSYYIADYFPLVQDINTHSSMNHVLGGMNILLTAYEEFGDEIYLTTATKIQSAIDKEKDLWLRQDGDIWYKVSTDKQFIGRDYSHLTLEDLINSYKLWNKIDSSRLPVIEDLIRSKANYLSENKLGYTTKIKKGLKEIQMFELLPQGTELTDAQ